MSLLGFLLGMAVLADIEQKQKKISEKIEYEFYFKDTYREYYMDRFMKVN